MLNNIIPIYDDEILYSWIARNFKFSGFKSSTEYNKFLFNKNSSLDVDIYYNLEHFVNTIHTDTVINLRSIENVINKMTLVPFYTLFIDDIDDINSAYRLMATNNDRAFIRSLLKTFEYKFRGPVQLKICPLCAEEQMYKYGEIYLLREHQIINNRACYLHKGLLRFIDFKRDNYFHDINDFNWAEATIFDLPYKDIKKYIKIAEFIHYFLQIGKSGINSEVFKRIQKREKSLQVEKKMFFENLLTYRSSFELIERIQYLFGDIDNFLYDTI